LNRREVQLFLAGQALSLIYTPPQATFREKSGLVPQPRPQDVPEQFVGTWLPLDLGFRRFRRGSLLRRAGGACVAQVNVRLEELEPPLRQHYIDHYCEWDCELALQIHHTRDSGVVFSHMRISAPID
jgi:hypothetical protein